MMQRPPKGFVLMLTRPGRDRVILAKTFNLSPIVVNGGSSVDRLGLLSNFVSKSSSRYKYLHVMRWTDWYLVATVDPDWKPPEGYGWYQPSELGVQAVGFLPSPKNYSAWRGLLPASKTIIMYHGTTRSAAESIMKHGFKIRACSHGPGPIHCQCSMMGPCVYLAPFDKARDYAVRRPDWKPVAEGVLLRVEVKTERLMLKRAEPACTCCEQPFVDHPGDWIRSGASGVWLGDGSLPACRRAELAVADTSILTPLEIITEFEAPMERDHRVSGKSRPRTMHSK